MRKEPEKNGLDAPKPLGRDEREAEAQKAAEAEMQKPVKDEPTGDGGGFGA